MNIEPKPIDAAELALRFMARRGRGDWLALVVERGSDPALAAQELADEMDSVADTEVERIADPADPADLAARLAASTQPVVVSGLDGWGDSEWASLDHLRSRLARDERTALVLSRAAFEAIMRAAPNFSSWLGASAWTYAPRAAELTEEERLRLPAAPRRCRPTSAGASTASTSPKIRRRSCGRCATTSSGPATRQA